MAAVTLVEGQNTPKPQPTPVEGGFAGVVFGATGTSATRGFPATVKGYAAVVCLYEGKQAVRFLRLDGDLENMSSIQARMPKP